jgi:pimeloyl-ACP methyl ester carboxylesterase
MDHEELITLADGRTLEVASWGDATKPTVVFHHGTPGSVRTIAMFQPLLDRGDFFLVTTSRAGYGRSSRHAGRSFASVVADTRAALDHLGRDSYTSLGWSGGGPHALACAALDAPRCRGVVVVASVVPIDAGIDWTEGMGPENLEEFALALEGGPAFEAAIEAAGAFLSDSSPANVLEVMGGLLSVPDRAVLDDDALRRAFAESTAYGFVEGWRGFFDDDVAIFTPWGFDPTTIETSVDVFFGDADLMVPAAHGQWLARHLPTATAHHHPAEGHLSIFANHLDELVAALATSAKD